MLLFLYFRTAFLKTCFQNGCWSAEMLVGKLFLAVWSLSIVDLVPVLPQEQDCNMPLAPTRHCPVGQKLGQKIEQKRRYIRNSCTVSFSCSATIPSSLSSPILPTLLSAICGGSCKMVVRGMCSTHLYGHFQ